MSLSSHMLTFEEVSRLDQVLDVSTQVHGRGNFPTLNVTPKSFIKLLLNRLINDGIVVKDVRINGSVASYVLNGDDTDFSYNDLDLIFNVELRSRSHFELVKDAALDSLLDFLPAGVSKERMGSCTLNDAYVRKMVKVTNNQAVWSLISLSNNEGRNIELKFVDTMKRQFEFSVDSFQIILDSLLNFHEATALPMTEDFFPSVTALSVFGDFDVALHHLKNKLIATSRPEEIRGGGLLKYCTLLIKGFKPASPEICQMEKYMCSRFFIDFKDISSQRQKLDGYLNSHFINDNATKYNYLMTLYNVVRHSTVCLMSHERRQILHMIGTMANDIYKAQTYQEITVFYSLPPYVHHPAHSPTTYLQHPKEYVMLGTWKTHALKVEDEKNRTDFECLPAAGDKQTVQCH